LPSLWGYASLVVRFIVDVVEGLFDPTGQALADKTGTPTAPILQDRQSPLGELLEKTALLLAEGLVEGLLPVWKVVLALLGQMLDLLWKTLAGHMNDTGTRRAWILVNFAFANLRGAFTDNVFEKGFDVLDEQDYRAWLGKYAVEDGGLMLASPWAYFMYDAEFAYVDGDTSRPDIAAGASLRTLIRMAFTYKGALIWKMQAGMGDTVFAPFYLALKKRGVRFCFFHRVSALHLGGPERRTITSIEVEVQARTKDGKPYDPLVDVNGLPCWPSDTLWEQIAEPKDHSINLEDPKSPALDTITLVRGYDFDDVVLATPIATLPALAKELIDASPRWRRMVEQVKCVRTQALQLWLTPTAYELGWTAMGRPLLAGFHRSPLNTWADMSHLGPRESWPSKEGRFPKSIAYFTGPLCTTEDPVEENRRVSFDLVENAIGWLFPNATKEKGATGPLDWDLLVDDRTVPGVGKARMDAQYLRANYWPSELFTLSLHGTTKYRIAPGDTDFDNLVIAGDWTENGFNIGNVEATMMSGMLASNALVGYPARQAIIGVDFGRSPETGG